MSLADQLSLSKNGGVYYSGTRVKPTPDPILFIGLGGTGADAILRVKNEVQSRMILPHGPDGRITRSTPNNIAFLAIDTDKDILNKTCGIAHLEETNHEFLQICVPGLHEVIQSVVDHELDKPQWNWYDKNLTAAGGLDGANGIRQIGRFMLFWNFQKVRECINTVVSSILTVSRPNNNLKIFILSGIGGGTGSGTFLDIAYLARTLSKALTPNVQVQGYIFTPDLNKGNGGDDASMYRNGFAALKELDYWMSIAEHEHPFVQQYPGGYTLNSIDKPYDFCHIITAQDAQHHIVSYTEAMDAVGNNLFSYIVNEENLRDTDPPAIKTMYDNIGGYIITATAQASYPANYNYLSVGSNKLEIPYTEITTLLAARVFEKLEPVFNHEPNRDSFARDLHSLQLEPQTLYEYICHGVQPMPITGKTFSYNDIWPGNRPYQMVNQWLNGHAQQQLRLNHSNFASYEENILRKYLETLSRTPDFGPCYAARLIYSNTSFCLIKSLKGLADDCRERASTAASKVDGFRNTMMQEWAGGQKAGVFSKNNAAKSYMLALQNWIDTEFAYWRYYELAEALDKFVKRLEIYRDKIFKPLLDTLMILPGVFRDNYNYIVTEEKEAQKDPTAFSKLLIRPLEFETKYRDELGKRVNIAAGEFLNKLFANLKSFTGITMDEIDRDIIGATDISGFIAGFINDQFSTTLHMSIEGLLQKRIPAGTAPEVYYTTVLNSLSSGAIPMFHTDVTQAGLHLSTISMVSVPDDCPNVYSTSKDQEGNLGARTKSSSERSCLQWVKVQAGMPLFAFPEVLKMEKVYESAMQANEATRRGVHLRWEWREQLPSPLPEALWADPNAPEKAFSKKYNAEIRAAFDKLVAANIIRPNAAGDSALLYVSSLEALERVQLHGTVTEKIDLLRSLPAAMWSDASTAVKLSPFGAVADGKPLMDRVRENALRFYNVSEEIKRQAQIYDCYCEKLAALTAVEQYVQAIFAELIYDQGFDRRFRRAQNDIYPVKLLDKMKQTAYPDYDTYKAFCDMLKEKPEIRSDIGTQFDTARQSLLAADGSFNTERVTAKMQLMDEREAAFSAALAAAKTKIDQTPIDQRAALLDTADFYSRAIELIQQIKKLLQA